MSKKRKSRKGRRKKNLIQKIKDSFWGKFLIGLVLTVWIGLIFQIIDQYVENVWWWFAGVTILIVVMVIIGLISRKKFRNRLRSI